MTNVIYTKKALQGIHDYNLTQNMIYDVIVSGQRFPGHQQGSFMFKKTVGSDAITVVGKQSDEGGWIVFTCWSKSFSRVDRRPPDPRFRNAPLWKRILVELAKIFGF